MEQNYSKGNNDNLERLDDLLRSGSYDQLAQDDRAWVDRIIGEQSFRQLGLLLAGIREEKYQQVEVSTKADLMKRFKSKHQSVWSKVWKYQVSALVPVVIILLAVATILLLPTKERIVVDTVEIPSIPVVDTVFVQIQPDTVYVEKQVQVPVYITQLVEKEPESVATDPVVVREKSLADQQEVRVLLNQVGID